MMILNKNWRNSEKTYSTATSSTTNLTWIHVGLNSDLPDENWTFNHLSPARPSFYYESNYILRKWEWSSQFSRPCKQVLDFLMYLWTLAGTVLTFSWCGFLMLLFFLSLMQEIQIILIRNINVSWNCTFAVTSFVKYFHTRPIVFCVHDPPSWGHIKT
jgi:hypothetical protein